MLNKREKEYFDSEWIALITEAKETGMSAEQVKQALNHLKNEGKQRYMV